MGSRNPKKISEKAYNAGFFESQKEGSRRSADQVVPLILKLLNGNDKTIRRVVDVGCGVGTWLSAFDKSGVEDIWGIDGDYIDRSSLQFPAERFIAHNLQEGLPWSKLDKSFDLALCLEVGEHLPTECASDLVSGLARLSPVIVFSAAVPHQPGTNHINSQWQSWWQTLFSHEGYLLFDAFRPKLWTNPNVEWWYAQNMFLYVHADSARGYPNLGALGCSLPVDVIHPGLHAMKSDIHNLEPIELLRVLPYVVSRAITRRLRGHRSR